MPRPIQVTIPVEKTSPTHKLIEANTVQPITQMTLTGLPFADIRDLLRTLPESDLQAVETVRQRNAALAYFGDLGELSWMTEWFAGWSGVSPTIARPMVALFAGTHGSVSQEEQNEVAARVSQLAAGGSPLNTVCGNFDLGLKVFDLALAFPVGDITSEDALDEKSAAGTLAFGMEAIAGSVDILCLADCGGQSAPSAAAMFLALYGGPASRWAQSEAVAAIAEQAVQRTNTKTADPLEVLRRLGGRENCALTGAICAARIQHVPVILDGAGALAAAAVIKSENARGIHHCVAAPSSLKHEREMIEALALRTAPGPATGLGDGVNAAFAAGMLRAVSALHSETPVPKEVL